MELMNITVKHNFIFYVNHTGSRMVIFSNILTIIAFNFLGLDLMMADIAETIVV
jgi:hypothetical protein